MKKRKSEIATILMIGAVIVMGVTAVISSFTQNDKRTTSSRASIACESPQKPCGNSECYNPSTQTCVRGMPVDLPSTPIPAVTGVWTTCPSGSANEGYFVCKGTYFEDKNCTVSISSTHTWCRGANTTVATPTKPSTSTPVVTAVPNTSCQTVNTGCSNERICCDGLTCHPKLRICTAYSATPLPCANEGEDPSKRNCCPPLVRVSNGSSGTICKKSSTTPLVPISSAIQEYVYDCNGKGGVPYPIDAMCSTYCKSTVGSDYVKNSQGTGTDGLHYCCCGEVAPVGSNGKPDDACSLIKCKDGEQSIVEYSLSLSQYGIPLSRCSGNSTYGGILVLTSRVGNYSCDGNTVVETPAVEDTPIPVDTPDPKGGGCINTGFAECTSMIKDGPEKYVHNGTMCCLAGEIAETPPPNSETGQECKGIQPLKSCDAKGYADRGYLYKKSNGGNSYCCKSKDGPPIDPKIPAAVSSYPILTPFSVYQTTTCEKVCGTTNSPTPDKPLYINTGGMYPLYKLTNDTSGAIGESEVKEQVCKCGVALAEAGPNYIQYDGLSYNCDQDVRTCTISDWTNGCWLGKTVVTCNISGKSKNVCCPAGTGSSDSVGDRIISVKVINSCGSPINVEAKNANDMDSQTVYDKATLSIFAKDGDEISITYIDRTETPRLLGCTIANGATGCTVNAMCGTL